MNGATLALFPEQESELAHLLRLASLIEKPISSIYFFYATFILETFNKHLLAKKR